MSSSLTVKSESAGWIFTSRNCRTRERATRGRGRYLVQTLQNAA